MIIVDNRALLAVQHTRNRANEKTQRQLKKARQQTDDSLTQERQKTDESYLSGREDAQDNTDEIISKDRMAADKDRSQSRSAADKKQDTDQDLSNQRKSEDNAIQAERSSMDTALEYERGEKEKLMDKLVIQEREATDKNLLSERAKTDLDSERAAALLTVAHAAHAETKSALTTREEFVAIVSHDLRNPIGVILSTTEIILSNSSIAEVSDSGKKLIELIRRSAETSLRLISAILDMERIVEGKLQLELTENRIEDLIHESIESHRHVAAAKKILLKANVSSMSHSISCDKDRVGQILSNLIGNALKFTPTGGSVTVETSESKSEITVSVHDTGIGIPDDQKNRIFERFAQIGNKQRAGLGLGLYISKTLVESHLGRLWVTSTPGSGSIFWFTLPL